MSQAEWERVMGTNPSNSNGSDLPVQQVHWEDRQEFCRKTGLKLLMEAQYACRAGTPGPHAGTGRLEDMGWCTSNSGNRTHPVGQKLPNGLGLHDMPVNVFEWCEDVHDWHFYGRAEARAADPVCTSGSDFRVLRGGRRNTSAGYSGSANRFLSFPADRSSDVGFRPAVPSP